jgi:hypothetical protein
MCDPAISVTVRTPSVCEWFAAGRRRNDSEYVGNGPKFVRSERLPPKKFANASHV